ncbi:NAD(P)/FAD-dependent oxidoreductase [Streptosporangium sp. NPDC049376]|uniref:NAD(P)/FAD-dependent oxidoreductase n=1 Tax=Streptosporangium sp. NPDC049376 TaxID=3366192 RepID=UPI0037A26DF7
MTTEQTYVIVGAGLAGAKAAQSLREEGFDGRITLVGAESELPYERPPLSKGYLLGKEDQAKVYVHDEAWYREHSVELVSGSQVTDLDRGARRLELDGGGQIGYDKLLLATGASPRRLDVPGADLEGLHYLRDLGDSQRLRDAIKGGGRVVVVGAGWIGLETAAAAREYGCEVTVVEPRPVPLQAALGPEMGGFFADLHRRHGVDLRLGRQVTGVLGDGRVRAVATDDGVEVPADVVIVGVGVRPNAELAVLSGLPVDNGVLVDAALRTEDPDVYAAGDVANAFNPLYGTRVRVEHWANALNGGLAAGRSMLGQEVVYDRPPYFFSDQYDVGMEFSGWFEPGGYDSVVVRGEREEQAFYAFWLSGGRVVAGMHVNLWDDGIGPVQNLIRSGVAVDAERLADPGVPLADLAKS